MPHRPYKAPPPPLHAQAIWIGLYLIIVIAFGCGLFVLYRNHRAAIGVAVYDMHPSECWRLDTGLNSVMDAIRYLVEFTLSGGVDFYCFEVSSANQGGTLLAYGFAVFTVIVLFNMLIAMMAETFTRMSTDSFAHYAKDCAFFMVKWRQRTTKFSPLPLFTVLGVPFAVIQGLIGFFCGHREDASLHRRTARWIQHDQQRERRARLDCCDSKTTAYVP